MKVLAKTKTINREIIKSISLVEVIDMYTVITAETDGDNTNYIYANPNLTCNLMEALNMYKQAGGYISIEGERLIL